MSLSAMIWDGIFAGLFFGLVTFLYLYLVNKVKQGPPRPAALFLTSRGKRVTHMQLQDSQQLPLALEVEDQFENPTDQPLDGVPAWAVDDPTLGSLQVADDGLSAVFSCTGKLGTANVQVSGAAGGQPVAGSLQIDIGPGAAAKIVIKPGTPVNAPAAPAPAP